MSVKERIDSVAALFFAGMGQGVMLFDWKYADSIFIQPLQHLLSSGSYLIAIIIGLPVAIKHTIKFFSFIKTTFKKLKNKFNNGNKKPRS